MPRKTALQPDRTLSMVRSEVLGGLQKTDLVLLQRSIEHEIDRVTAYCRKRWITPQNLPFEHYQAFTALQALLREGYLDKFAGSDVNRELFILRLPGITKVCAALHQEISRVAETEKDGRKNAELTPQAAAVHALILKHQDSLQHILQGKNPGSLSISSQSWNALQWLNLLSAEAEFRKHLHAVRTAGEFLSETRQQGSRKLRSLPFQVHFYPGTTLYRSVVKAGVLVVTINEGFVEAPEKVLRAVIRASLSIRANSDRQLVSEYSSGERYLEVSRMLLHKPSGSFSDSGLFHDLGATATRVQDRYFSDMSHRPVVKWMRQSSYRTFGVYQASSHSIRISPALDHPDVPEYVLEYVLFHELVHAQVGVTVHRGRHSIHSREFQRVEKLFAERREAGNYLRSLSRKKYSTR